MKNLRILADDDDNDSLLFERLQQNALENHPNPARIGCPGYAVLEAFVQSPRSVDPEALNDLHIMQCAECTRELIELRQLRIAKPRRTQPVPIRWFDSPRWKSAVIGVCLCVAIILVMNRPKETARSARNDEVAKAVSLTLDLSGDGVTRSAEEARKEVPVITLPRKPLHLNIVLPFFSPPGNYRVTITKDKRLESIQAQSGGSATIDGPRAELKVDLDLERVAAGTYYLGTERIGGQGPYFYRMIIS